MALPLLRINRDVLAQFLPDHQSIIEFENIFNSVSSPTAAENVGVDTSNFDKVLSAADVNVQVALETLDELSHTQIQDIGTNTHVVIDAHIADGDIHFTVPSIDHGLIAGLADDDHTQYILVAGTRAFTGPVGGITPVADSDLATKGYVDDNDFWQRSGTRLSTKTAGDSLDIGGDFTHGNQILISDPSQLPAAVANVITLLADTTYYFTNDIDLTGDRLVGLANTCILGASSENASITSTGLGAGVALFTTDYTTPIRHITFKDVDTCMDIDGSRSGQTPALDWTGVNFNTIPNIGIIKDCDNFIFSKGAIIASEGIIFDGTIGTVGIDNSIFVGSGSAGNIIELKSTATISRRFRMIYSSMVVFGSTVGLNINTSATLPSEGYILDTVNFSGGGTFTSGVAYTDDKARFIGVRGVSNSAEIGAYYMINNATVTTISTSGVPVKVEGTTTANAVSQKFSHTDNKDTYNGALTRIFKVSVVASFTSGNNKDISVYIAKNGTIDPTSEMQSTTDGNGRAESIACQTILELEENDYIEVWIENNSGTNNITVEYLNVITEGLVS